MFSDSIAEFIMTLTEWVAGLESWQQLGALILISAIPFVESYSGSFLGVLVGINPFVAVIAAVIGNTISTFALIAGAGRARTAVTGNGSEKELTERQVRRRAKISKYFDRFGVPGVSLLGPLALPSQFTGPAMVALGASKRSVYFWMGISIIAWGVLFGFFSHLVVDWIY
ncbi:small multi-drug export protein [Demequina sp. NBRC 110055]|uniref:small multi-drug export protein n=1 Tax=Demequina sp. NBRC 110055 TaxID=1570344 RepID=UPI000A0745C5|nr:small multi-drug export protein [Demequina sp. NBRC 110055]